MIKLDLVIVTYNRLEKLKKALRCYEMQTEAFRNLIIVNNRSTDGTDIYLSTLPKSFYNNGRKTCDIIVTNTDENLGGSGGFFIGENAAMKLGADWVFVADDDAYAYPTMGEKFYDFTKKHDTTHIAAICSQIVHCDGKICLSQRQTYHSKGWRFERFFSNKEDYLKDSFSIDLLTYVGSFMNAEALKKVGLVRPDFFIYYDDSEHSLRLKKYGNIIVVPSIVIEHECGRDVETSQCALSWREYYNIRNRTFTMLKHHPLVGIKAVLGQILDDIHAIRISKTDNSFLKLSRKAIWNAFFQKMGKDDLYKPGWKP